MMDMAVSKRAINFAEACRDGDIIEGKPVQLELLARNAQVLIDEYEPRIAELEAASATSVPTVEDNEGYIEIKGGVKFCFHRNGDVTIVIEMANGHEIDLTLKDNEFDNVYAKRQDWLRTPIATQSKHD